MEAKDTVMRVKCHCERLYKECHCFCDDCNSAKIINEASEAQAEISFKAGIKEVVGWVAATHPSDNILLDKWQAKLKEWGQGVV